MIQLQETIEREKEKELKDLGIKLNYAEQKLGAGANSSGESEALTARILAYKQRYEWLKKDARNIPLSVNGQRLAGLVIIVALTQVAALIGYSLSPRLAASTAMPSPVWRCFDMLNSPCNGIATRRANMHECAMGTRYCYR